MRRPTLRDLGKACVLATVYALLAHFGLTIQPVNTFASLVWAPSGVALAAMVVMGYPFWPSIFVGAFIANLWAGAPVAVGLGIGVGNTLEALAGAWALRRIPGFQPTLERLQDVLALILLAGVLSTTISATIGVSSLVAGGVLVLGQASTTWRVWWLGDLVGDLIVAPALLTWIGPRHPRPSAGRLAEIAVLAVLLTGAALTIFERSGSGMAALLSPFLVWAAIRFERRGAARANLLICAIAVWATARGHGPFAREGAAEALFHAQEFMALTAGTFLVLGTVIGERRRADEELARASAAKDRFLAALSHELRTPLTPVVAISSALERDAEIPIGARRRIETLRRNAELEARLIDDLLDLTRIANEKLSLSPEPVALGEALDHVVEICRADAAAKGLALEREVPSREDVFVQADPARLRQVFWNLLKNAIQFTPSGGRIRLRVSPAKDRRVAVEISDSGVGIEASEIGRIFGLFQQSEKRRGGLGLGLAISRALVEAQGGTLHASSPGPGGGATFRVELPLAKAAPSASSGAAARPAPPAASRRVLLIEDHADTLAALRDLLFELSCDVVAAGSLREALDAAEAKSFDLVLSDLGLPDGNGHELMSRLRERYGLEGIAVTGYGMEEDVRRSRESGFVDHLVKPITFEKLEAAVERFFTRRERSAAS